MAIAATAEYEIDAATGNDLNGGGFNASRTGATKTATDNYTYGASQHVYAYTGLYSDGANLNTLKDDTRPFIADDVGHVIQLTAVGTNRTATKYFEIVSVAAGVATLDANAWSAASAAKDATGKLGGSLLTMGQFGAMHVGGNLGWLKYNASPYVAVITTVNTATGPVQVKTGTEAAPTIIRGYDLVRGDTTGRRPTFAWGADAPGGALLATS